MTTADIQPAPLVGRTVVDVRAMTREELQREYWGVSFSGRAPVAVVFDDGTVLYASTDSEGNGPGALFGYGPDGEGFTLAPTA